LIRRFSAKKAGYFFGLLWSWYGNRVEEEAVGEIFQDVGREHIPLGSAPPSPYNSNPPSSGGHFRSPANWGVYGDEVNDQIFIHNLEHGGVWIAYRPEVSQEVIGALQSIVDEVGGSKIVMAPRSTNDTDIAMVAWSRVLKFDLVDGALTEGQKNDLRAFYRQRKDRGPEFVPDIMPGIDPKEIQG
jgi:hypothetical protein